MKKTVIIFFCCLMAAMGASAQDLPTTVLKSSKGTNVFYGEYSFVEAINTIKSSTKDETQCSIVLSSGAFIAPDTIDVTNAPNIVIRGAGMEGAAVTIVKGRTGSEKTFLKAYKPITIEGVDFKCTFEYDPQPNKQYVRCKFSVFGGSSNGTDYSWTSGTTFINCRIDEMSCCYNSIWRAYNSIIGDWGNGGNETFEIYNCVLLDFYDPNSGIINNCILHNNVSGPSSFYEGTFYKNCIYIANNSSSAFEGQESTTNRQLPLDSISTVFKTYTGTYTAEETFELADEAKAKYLGTDGKQVGIYGGDYPYDSSVSYPHITKKTVAARTENGKLKVNVEIGVGNK